MIDEETRQAILTLHRRGLGLRAVARAVGVSRNTVKKVLKSGSAEVPRIERPELADEHRERVRELHELCQGNLVRVHEILSEEGVDIAYSTLTASCRRHEIGVKPKVRAGQYHFDPAQEMQHDTSPHDVVVGGKRRRLQCASLVLCYSRWQYSQLYPTWDRFHVKIFLTEGLCDIGGAAWECMVDNSNVILAHGTGKDAVPAPEMEAFGERYGFKFVAHEVGDANRSARVEGPFYHIERNFYSGRTFEDLDDLNAQLREWCTKKNRSYKRTLKASPLELLAVERPALRPLPVWVPEVYELHHRTVDLAGYVHLHGNRYSVSETLIGRRVEVRETKDSVRVFEGPRQDSVHTRLDRGAGRRSTLEHHRRKRRSQGSASHLQELPEERELRAASPQFGRLIDALRRKYVGRAVRAIRELHRLYLDYPDVELMRAVEDCLRYGLTDLKRLERMVLKAIAGHFFKLQPPGGDADDD